jgi:hypothetical protein
MTMTAPRRVVGRKDDVRSNRPETPGRWSLSSAVRRRQGAVMVLTRLRMDELVNAWVSDENTPFQTALLGTFDAGPFRRPYGTVDVPRIRRELTAHAHRVPALGRRVVWTRLGEGRPVWTADPAFDPAGHRGGGPGWIREAAVTSGPSHCPWALAGPRSAQRSSGR